MNTRNATPLEDPSEARIANSLAHASLLQRLLAGLFDMVLLFFIHYGLYSLVVATPMGDQMRAYREEMRDIQDVLKLQTGYGEKVVVTLDEYKAYYSNYKVRIDTQTWQWYVVKNRDFPTTAEKNLYYSVWENAVKSNDAYAEYSMRLHLHNYLITAVFVGGILEFCWFFVVPMIKKKGATVGMLIVGIRMVSVSYYGNPRWYQYLGRFFFIYLVESCFPYFFLANWTLLAVPSILIIVMMISPRKRTVHDFISGIMCMHKSQYHEISAPSKEEIDDE